MQYRTKHDSSSIAAHESLLQLHKVIVSMGQVSLMELFQQELFMCLNFLYVVQSTFT